MPQVSRFRGISVEMYHDDHPPPHFHVYYADESAIIELETVRIMGGRLSPRIHRLVIEWGRRRRAQLRENWRRVVAHEPPLWIEPDE
jgi:hypothetical protein